MTIEISEKLCKAMEETFEGDEIFEKAILDEKVAKLIKSALYHRNGRFKQYPL